MAGMSEADQAWLGRGIEQDVWEATAAAIDASSLSNEGRSALRYWAMRQMAGSPGRVWKREDERGQPVLRQSFRRALEHATSDIVAGRHPN